MTKRIMVVANKHWEVDPLVSLLLSEDARPRESFESIEVVNHPFFMEDRKGPNPKALPRVEVRLKSPKAKGRLEVWCIEDLMNPKVSSSSTHEKHRVLGRAFGYESRSRPDLVIAFGTAGGAPGVPLNGSVVVGNSVFIHDPFAHSHDGEKHWKPPRTNQVIECSCLPKGLFREISEDVRFPAEGRFLRPPLQPAPVGLIIAGDAYVALCNVNITDYDDYAWADEELLHKFAEVERGRSSIGSLETTHGLIRELAGDETAFVFVSGIADEIGKFGYQVTPRVYAQNLVAAHNAGVAVAWLIPQLLGLLAD